MVKRLVIKASNNYVDGFQIIPVNTGKPVRIESDIGVFTVAVNIADFDGSHKVHQANSCYNLGDTKYLNQEPFDRLKLDIKDDDSLKLHDIESTKLYPGSHLNLIIGYRPKYNIKGDELLFGNDFTLPIRDHVPTTLLLTGLKFFTWFVNKTVKGDIYSDKPYIYGLALNSFTHLGLTNSALSYAKDIEEAGVKGTTPLDFKENLIFNHNNNQKFPESAKGRIKWFHDGKKCSQFTYYDDTDYFMQFDTNFLKMGDSKYYVSLPTFGNKTFDIDVLKYANNVLDNVNWTIKQNGWAGVGEGNYGLVVNFSLIDEDEGSSSESSTESATPSSSNNRSGSSTPSID